MSYSKIGLEDVDASTRTDAEPAVKMIGYDLKTRGDDRPNEMRVNYFYYDEGDAVRRHYQQQQEEIFYVVSGHARMEIDGEEFDIEAGDCIVVDPGPMRQIHALEATEIFAVGAPNLREDAVFEEDLENNNA
jgi:mannose-6-phosphate isomerase-like protein (cupin superfamily)